MPCLGETNIFHCPALIACGVLCALHAGHNVATHFTTGLAICKVRERNVNSLIKLATPVLFGHRRSTSLPPAFAFQALAWTTCIHFAQQALTTQRSQEFWRKYPPTAFLKTWKSDPSFHHVHCQSSACRRVLALEAPARMFEEKTSKKKTYTNPCTNTTRTNICGDVFTDAKCGNRDGYMWPQSWHLHVRMAWPTCSGRIPGLTTAAPNGHPTSVSRVRVFLMPTRCQEILYLPQVPF